MLLKGQSNKIFDLRFFSSLEPVWATDQKVKIFSILVKNSQVIQILSSKIWLSGVWDPDESVSTGYHTPASQ